MGSTGTGVVRRAAVLGIASPMLFVLLVVVMGFIHPGYSHLTNFISDLGALDAPIPYVQRLNFFQFGIGIAVLAWALYMGMDQPSRVALVLQVIIGVGIFLSGIFPGHSNDPGSRETMLHNLVGIPAFLMIMLVPLVAGWRFRRSEAWRGLSAYSISMTPVLVAMFVLMARADASPTGAPGLFQRLFIGTWLFWMVVIAHRLHRLEGQPI
jgi:hypothetical membrane protein